MNYSNRPIRIAIADDHEIFREGFRILLKNQSEVELVGEAENGQQLLDVAGKEGPDVAIVDIKMPVMDGIETCKQLRMQFPEMKVIALSMFNDENLIVDMLEAGARGYLLKNTNRHELVKATRTVFEGSTYYCEATSAKLARMIAERDFNPQKPKRVQKFKRREIDIIRMICKQRTNKEIATELGLSIRTVESYREKILEKTGARNLVGIAVYAIKNNLYEP